MDQHILCARSLKIRQYDRVGIDSKVSHFSQIPLSNRKTGSKSDNSNVIKWLSVPFGTLYGTLSIAFDPEIFFQECGTIGCNCCDHLG